jgi:hypothetical protein
MALSGRGLRPLVGSYFHSNEPLGSIKDRNFFYQLNECWLLKDFTRWNELVVKT